MNLISKILLVTNIPTIYRILLFNELKEQLERKGLGLKAVFTAMEYAGCRWVVGIFECKFFVRVLTNFIQSLKIYLPTTKANPHSI